MTLQSLSLSLSLREDIKSGVMWQTKFWQKLPSRHTSNLCAFAFVLNWSSSWMFHCLPLNPCNKEMKSCHTFMITNASFLYCSGQQQNIIWRCQDGQFDWERQCRGWDNDAQKRREPIWRAHFNLWRFCLQKFLTSLVVLSSDWQGHGLAWGWYLYWSILSLNRCVLFLKNIITEKIITLLINIIDKHYWWTLLMNIIDKYYWTLLINNIDKHHL